MVAFKFSAIALVALNALSVVAKDAASTEKLTEKIADENKQQTSTLAVEIETLFPDAEIFGIKLVNGVPTRAVLDITNKEPEPVTVLLVGGNLATPLDRPGAPSPQRIVRNITNAKYTLQIPAGAKETINYAFTTELHPQDLNLNIISLLADFKGTIHTFSVFNETVTVVEAPISIFDPQIIFLYLFLAGLFGGLVYFIYTTWIAELFPQKKRGGKGGERAQRSSGGSKKVDPTKQVSVAGADGPAVAASTSGYDESWIPASHLAKPQTKRVGSGRGKSRAA